MNTTTLKPKERTSNRRAVAPVIATLLMVAIAVVGGTIIFVFSQGFFSSSQISGSPTIEAVKILGYDARPVADLQMDDASTSSSPGSSASGDGDADVEQDERIAVYLTNDSVQKIVISELSFGGTIYNYTTVTGDELTDWNDAGATSLSPGRYAILSGGTAASGSSVTLDEGAAELQAGETATILIDLDSDLRVGRGTQFKMTTTNGAVFVSTVNVGQQAG